MRNFIRISIVWAAMAMFSSTVVARTWYIKVDGSGDAPTIEAGMDSALSGDVVLVGPGTFQIADVLRPKDGVTVMSEQGPLKTIVEPLSFPDDLGAFSLQNNTELNGFWIKPFLVGNIVVVSKVSVRILNNIIEPFGVAITVLESSVEISHNLILPGGAWGIDMYYLTVDDEVLVNNNIILSPVRCGTFYPNLGDCNDIFATMTPGNCIVSIYESNFSLDPMFCGVSGSGNYFLQSDSPCAPGNHPTGASCGLIGPLPVACGTVGVEERTWGAIKSLYEDGR